MKFYVYMYLRAVDSKNGKAGSPYYIGKGKGYRAFSADRKITHRPKNLSQISMIAENLTEVDAFQLEILLIHLHGRLDIGTGYLRNRTVGGEGSAGHIPSPESIERRAAARRGVSRPPFSEEWRRKLSEAKLGKLSPRKGIKCSEENCRRIGDSKRGIALSEEHRAKVSAGLKGRIVSPETRAKISAAHMGKIGHTPSAETRAKMGASQKGRVHSAETKAKMSASAILRESLKHQR